MEWQPIETAPKEDFKPILIHCAERKHTFIGIWWRDAKYPWYGEFVHNNNAGGKLDGIATHWMPIPEPPEREKTK